MNRRHLGWTIALVLLAQVGQATAQVGLRGSHADSGFPLALTAAPPGEHPSTGGSPLAPSTEPKSMTGMLAALNDARRRMDLPPFTWSQDLTAQADAAVRAGAAGSCQSVSIVARLGKIPNASIYWAAATARITGDGAVQDIQPSYVVSQWRKGQPDYDAAAGRCRKDDGSCLPFSRMAAPAAKAVGCAKAICASGAQIWVCQYSNQ